MACGISLKTVHGFRRCRSEEHHIRRDYRLTEGYVPCVYEADELIHHFEIEAFVVHIVWFYIVLNAKLQYNQPLVKKLHFSPIVTFLSVLLITSEKKIY